MTLSTVNIAAALRRAVSCWPDREAIVSEGRTRTWREVDVQVGHLETFLVDTLLLKPGDRLAIFARNSEAHLCYLFAAARRRITVVGINVQWSPQEVSHALSDSRARACVYDSALGGVLAKALRSSKGTSQIVEIGGRQQGASQVVEIGGRQQGSFAGGISHVLHPSDDKLRHGWGAGGGREGGATIRAPTCEECSILYTSGSSGRAKGVLLSHLGHMIQALEKVAQVGYSHETRYLNCVPLYHVGGVSSALAVTLCGGCHVMMPKFDGAQALRIVATTGCNALVAVPTMIEMMIHASAAKQVMTLPMVRTVLVGGQSMSQSLVHRARRLLPHAAFIQTFACTEASSSITFSVISTPDQPITDAHKARQGRTQSGELVTCLPVGRPGHHCEVAIFDDAAESPAMVPRGTIGRIATAGAHVMMGYANLPKETREAVVGGWLFTGDVGFLDRDGTLCFTSRSTDRINSGGEKVFAREVEEALLQHAAVEHAAVFGVDHGTLGQAVVAAVVLCANRKEAGEEDLRAHCKRLLSGYKVPRHVFLLEELPYTPSGKVIKHELRIKCLEMMKNMPGARSRL